MSKTKLTLCMNVGTQDVNGNPKRIGGISESFYCNEAIGSDLFTAKMTRLINARAALLPQGASLILERAQTVDPVAGSRSYGITRAGGSGLPTDNPEMCLNFNMRSANGLNRRTVCLRAAPDSLVVTGEYRNNTAFDALLARYFALIQQDWMMKGRVRTNPQIKVGNVTEAGVVTCLTDHDLSPGDDFLFLRTRNAANELVQGIFAVTTVQTNLVFTIWNWAHDGFGAIPKGTVRLHEEDYFNLDIGPDEILAPIATTREVGGPFKAFVGVHSKKR